MAYEYGLIAVLIASGYWGWYFVRRQPHGTPTFGYMQLAAAALAGLALIGRAYETGWAGVVGAIGLGAGACLLVVGPLVRALARRMVAAERLGVAGRLLDVAELLAPGSGVAEEKALLGAMTEIRDGRVEQTVDALTAAKDRAPAEARLAIDERIAMLYLAAYRWGDAIAHAEAHLFGADAAPAAGTTGSLRDALGLAPPVWVELIGAYGRTGDLERAGQMLARLEEVCARRDDAGLWLHRARLMFLALAGRPAAVRALVEPRHARYMSAAARSYWVAVAHQHHGDREAAGAAYAKARGRSRGRPRALIDQALATLGSTSAAELSPATREIVERTEAAPPPAQVRRARPTGPWATLVLCGALIATAATIAIALGASSDPGVLLRAGAMVRGRIDDGERWRLITCMFVHVGAVHLVANVIGMYVLGRVSEELFGGARTLAIYGLAGLAGATASYLASPVGVSAGASGAIFGLLGAVFVELTWHRQHYRAAWKRGLWGGLVVVTLAQAGIGFLYPVIDQWAHGAGLAGGALAGALLSPHARWARIGRHAGRVVAAAFAAAALTALVLAARTSIADSLAGAPRARRVIGGVAITAPAAWHSAGELSDPDRLIFVAVHAEPVIRAADQIAALLAAAPTLASKRGFDRTEPVADRVIALPPGWDGGELIASFEDALGHRQRYRVIGCGRAFGDRLILLMVFAPESFARGAPALFSELIGSAGPASPRG